MPLTRNFNDLVKSRVAADPAFRQALFREAVQTMLDGDVATAKSALRDYINATIGFERLSLATETPAKSLMRMFGRHGNPTAANLLGVISALQKQTGLHLEVAAVANAA
jgi:DNA-binding phage protein